MIKNFARNTIGRDFVVGDIHGCFSRLQAHLDHIGFDPVRDRLFSVGDLVDRGPESEDADEWLSRPWFHAVRGNHEQMAIDAARGLFDPRNYVANGGAWFMALPKEHQRLIADVFETLPIAIELETEGGLVGILHADCPVDHWDQLQPALAGKHGETYEMMCMWSRDRIKTGSFQGVVGVRAVVVGHTPVKRFTSLDNVLYIDTGAVFRERDFTILDAATLQPVPLKTPSLDWVS